MPSNHIVRPNIFKTHAVIQIVYMPDEGTLASIASDTMLTAANEMEKALSGPSRGYQFHSAQKRLPNSRQHQFPTG